jgi:hypothetical protein
MKVEELHRALGGEITRGKYGPQVLCPGPGHLLKDRSLAVAPSNTGDGFVVHSFAGDDPIVCKDYVRDKVGLPPFRPSVHAQQRKIAKIFDYIDESGSLLFQVIKFAPKGFAQRRPDGKSGYIANLDGVRRVLYRLPELIEALANGNPAFVVEGEKDVDALWKIKIPATSNSGGAEKWLDEYSEYFKGATVYIIPDNDEPGRRHAKQVLESLTRVGATVRVIELPDLPYKGDVSDWLDAGGTPEQLYALADAAQTDLVRTSDQVAIAEPALLSKAQFEAKTGASEQLQWLDMSNWDNDPVPERQWAIKDRAPLNQVGLFSGEGGTGKSIIELMKDVAHVARKDWLGSLPEPGPAFYLGAEDDKDELHIRLAAIAKHYDVTFSQLSASGLYVLCLLGQDATLCAANGKSGKVEERIFTSSSTKRPGMSNPRISRSTH